MEIHNGDSVIFGKKYCESYGREYTGKPILFTMQTFENDNGYYSCNESCLGVWNEKKDEPDSIYHLFGNNLENIMDCKIIKATKKSIAEFNRIEKEKQDAFDSYWDDWGTFHEVKEKQHEENKKRAIAQGWDFVEDLGNHHFEKDGSIVSFYKIADHIENPFTDEAVEQALAEMREKTKC